MHDPLPLSFKPLSFHLDFGHLSSSRLRHVISSSIYFAIANLPGFRLILCAKVNSILFLKLVLVGHQLALHLAHFIQKILLSNVDLLAVLRQLLQLGLPLPLQSRKPVTSIVRQRALDCPRDLFLLDLGPQFNLLPLLQVAQESEHVSLAAVSLQPLLHPVVLQPVGLLFERAMGRLVGHRLVELVWIGGEGIEGLLVAMEWHRLIGRPFTRYVIAYFSHGQFDIGLIGPLQACQPRVELGEVIVVAVGAELALMVPQLLLGRELEREPAIMAFKLIHFAMIS